MAHETSPDCGDTHHAPVRLPPADPVEMQRMVGPLTSTCPCLPSPMGVPNKATSASRDACGSAEGHGCPGEQDPSSSRAAIPASLRRGPSSHHTGPSPSQTAVGVHAKACP